MCAEREEARRVMVRSTVRLGWDMTEQLAKTVVGNASDVGALSPACYSDTSGRQQWQPCCRRTLGGHSQREPRCTVPKADTPEGV